MREPKKSRVESPEESIEESIYKPSSRVQAVLSACCRQAQRGRLARAPEKHTIESDNSDKEETPDSVASDLPATTSTKHVDSAKRKRAPSTHYDSPLPISEEVRRKRIRFTSPPPPAPSDSQSSPMSTPISTLDGSEASVPRAETPAGSPSAALPTDHGTPAPELETLERQPRLNPTREPSSSILMVNQGQVLRDATLASIGSPPNAADLETGNFWVYGYPVLSLAWLAELNQRTFEPAGDQPEGDWPGARNCVANLKAHTEYPDVRLALVLADEQAVRRDVHWPDPESDKEAMEGEEDGEPIMWALSLVCAYHSGNYVGRPTIGHLRKLEPLFGAPRWFMVLKDRKRFSFED